MGRPTKVGNEHGQMLMSILTDSEGKGLLPMVAGQMRMYRKSRVDAPCMLYVDRDCCVTNGMCKCQDVWHLMRRFARCVATDSHHLSGLFMARLSFAIFELDWTDVDHLQEDGGGEGHTCEEPRSWHVTAVTAPGEPRRLCVSSRSCWTPSGSHSPFCQGPDGAEPQELRDAVAGAGDVGQRQGGYFLPTSPPGPLSEGLL
ncbi:uncharacterized protein LOC117809150 [Notolabrus celidotus]|uniref:uncharacterized protein LOC117809150 n=1 Tax=Notolabrus celidotus TaxID=1203425 RepID=UPI00148F84F2|nr:uncharacterized protein LOC117809150 [Notolabrus celidotus]